MIDLDLSKMSLDITPAERAANAPRPKLEPTAEQKIIIEAALNRSESILISALAGAAKTTTLELICAALPVSPILSLAFNKRIAMEMEKRLPGHVSCKTINSVGHNVWGKAVGKRLILDKDKSYSILKGFIDELPKAKRAEAWDAFGDTLKGISRAKLAGYVPDEGPAHAVARRLIEPEDFFEILSEDFPDADRELIDRALLEGTAQAYRGLIDFDDQVYMPTMFGGSFPQFPLVLVDEAQDLSPLNHEMLRKLVTKRLIAVGDPYQSIYGFRGAIASGMSILRENFSMLELGLSVSFRCPVAVVERARSRAPHMQHAPWAKPGKVVQLKEWGPDQIPDYAAVICRNNAPLFSLALRLLRAGRGVQLVGYEIGPSLIKTMKKFGPGNMPREQVLEAVDKWEEEQKKKVKRIASVADKAECLRVFATWGDTLDAAVAFAEHLFKSHGPVQLLSGHKSKGLEWDIVFHLDPWRIPSPFAREGEALQQELNVRYVIETRAKSELYLVSMGDFQE